MQHFEQGKDKRWNTQNNGKSNMHILHSSIMSRHNLVDWAVFPRPSNGGRIPVFALDLHNSRLLVREANFSLFIKPNL